MKYLKSTLLTLVFVCGGSLAQFSSAFDAGDVLVRAGIAHVNTDGEGDVVIAGEDSGLNASVDDDTQLGLNLQYFLTSNIAVELLAATPFDHDISLSNGLEFATVTHLPPTLSILYYFTNPDSSLLPYLGLGVNYTVFFDEDLSSAAETALNANDLSLDDSWGLAVQVGADYKLNDDWFLNASVRYIDIETTAEFNLGTSESYVDVSIDPLVASFTVGYLF